MLTQEQTLSLDMTDSILAQQVLSGDQEAFELLVRRYHTSLFNFIWRFLGDPDLAYDVLQEVFISFYLVLPTLKTDEPFKSWLFHVARNRCVDELRRKWRETLYFSQLDVEKKSEGELSALCTIPDPGPLPEEVVERHDLQILLQEAIQTLPPKFRSVVILRYTSQLSFPEIGRILSIPEARAKTYFHRAKFWLRKSIVKHL
jgi:RNA polymerase sigma factor (sigma-70 family)